MKSRRIMLLLLAVPALSLLASAQSLTDSGDSSGTVASTIPGATRSDYIASDRENEAPQLLLRCVWAVSSRWRSVSRPASIKRTTRRRSGSKG